MDESAIDLVEVSQKQDQGCDQGCNFKSELTDLINKHSIENESNTPDFILAQYLRDCLTAFGLAVTLREKWSDEGHDVHSCDELDCASELEGREIECGP